MKFCSHFQRNETIYDVKKLFENWKYFLNEEKKEINTKEELVTHLEQNPSDNLPTNINIDNPKGTAKAFRGSEAVELPFDYGEWTSLINPADGMGWDLIIAPGSSKTSQNLKPIGHVEYADGSGNDKMIVANGGSISAESKEVINKFFEGLGDSFKEVEWY